MRVAYPEIMIARSALYLRDVYGRTTEICPFRTTPDKTIIITFCRATNEVDDSALVKYVIFEKFRSDPEKDRSEVRLVMGTSIMGYSVLDVYFGRFWSFVIKNSFVVVVSTLMIL